MINCFMKQKKSDYNVEIFLYKKILYNIKRWIKWALIIWALLDSS
jgi:hypothetical protein